MKPIKLTPDQMDAALGPVRIDMAADLADMFGGQTEFEVSVMLGSEIIGAGHTLDEAVSDARATLQEWRKIRPRCGDEWPDQPGRMYYCSQACNDVGEHRELTHVEKTLLAALK